MFTVKEKETTKRSVGCISNGLILLVSGSLASLALLFMAISSIFSPSPLQPDVWTLLMTSIVLSACEAIGTYFTFYPEVSDGPNSALLNIPLLIVDITIGQILITLLQIPSLYWRLRNLFRLVFIALATLRYLGLAWTDRDCCLKKYIAPVRADKQLQFKPLYE